MYDTTPTFGGHRSRPEVEAALSSGVGTAIRRSQTTGEEMFFCAQRAGEHVVRLAIPTSRFYAPFRRARLGLVLAGLVGAASFLFIFLFTRQLRARIRERERQLAELRRAERFRSEFIANLTHEIKTPLTGIIGAVDLLDGGDDLPPDSRKTLFGLLRGESVRLNALAQDILELAHLEEQQRDDNASFAPADLSDIARSVQMRLQPKADAAHVRLVLGDLPSVTVPCDARLVEHALSNLVENALRYSGSPDVVISLAARDKKAVLAVEDHGVGIPPEHRARIFERFYRVDKNRSRDKGGTGLGLAIVKHIAQLHHGTATLEPVAGGGCRFELAIPLA
jgi:signal transduction histidine kinase